MTTYIALLRGINVGGNNKISMAVLSQSFIKMGFSDVSTYINSGNVIFTAKDASPLALSAKIERRLNQDFGFPIRVTVITSQDLKRINKQIPADWTNDADKRTEVLFLWPEYNKRSSLKLIPAVPGIDDVKFVSGAIIWHINRRYYNKSGLGRFIGTELYKNTTARNVNTVKKLVARITE